MIKVLKKLISKSSFYPAAKSMEPAAAYNLWAECYDAQPGNLMLHLDEQVFAGLLKGVAITNKKIADIGCGTGRHWTTLLQQNPLTLTGFDVSDGMLGRLKEKFPQADTSLIADNLFSDIPDHTFDVVISTLTIAHIENVAEALLAWSRILKPGGDIIITDFHPQALAIGGKRTFEHRLTQVSVQNFVHHVPAIEEILLSQGFHVVSKDEKIVDESVRHYYTAKNALAVYRKFEQLPIIYGIHLKRT